MTTAPQAAARESRPALASLAVAGCGAVWGVYWLPLRELQKLGFSGGWSTAAFYLVSLPPALLMAYWVRHELKTHGWNLVWLAVANGVIFILYSNAYTLTTVFNTLFLFYLSPVWSVLITRILFGERVGPARAFCVAIGLGGLVVMLSRDGDWPIPRNLGDWMSLGSGMLWAVISIYLRRNSQIGAVANTVGFFLGGILPALAFAVLLDGFALPEGASILAALPMLVGVVLLAWIPSQLALFWGVARISPVRTGILLMTELVSGVATAAWLSGDPISLQQAIGGAMILAAGLGDVLTARERTTPAPIPVSAVSD